MKLQKKKIVFLIGLSIFSALLNINYTRFSYKTLNNEEYLEIRNDTKIKISDYWVVNPIDIDDSETGVGAKNWTWAVSQDWCSLVNGFYVIENVTIDGQDFDNCIEIRHSNVPFIIKNCTLYNSYYGTVGEGAGISLYNVNNSQIINNNCSFNNGNGIRLHYGNNNTFTGNTVSNNSLDGIYIESTENNTITESFLINNKFGSGIGGYWNDNITISENILNNNLFGIYFNNCTNNTISRNIEINDNLAGIYLVNNTNIEIYGNIANDNIIAGIALEMSNDSTVIGNILNGNPICILEGITTGNIIKWNLCNGTTSPIIIDDSESGDFIWTETEKYIAWITGFGTENNPYIIEGITINGENSSSCIAIRESSKYFIIRDCTLINSSSGWGHGGIALFRVNNGMIINNDCTSNHEAGIAIIESNDNTISNNNVSNNIGNGMNVWYSDNNSISGNILNDNKGNNGMSILDSNNNTISENTINNNEYGVQTNGNDNEFIGNTVNFNNVGVAIDKSNDNIISGNTINNNSFGGISLVKCNRTTFSGNSIYGNYEGLILDGSNNNTFFENEIIGNDALGVWLLNDSGKCENNLFYNNNFTNPSGKNVVDNGTNNQWDNGVIGNYWHDYTGRDRNDDGIGDTPYYVPGSAGSQDNFPIWNDGPEPRDSMWVIITIIISSIGGAIVIAAIAIIYLRKRTQT